MESKNEKKVPLAKSFLREVRKNKFLYIMALPSLIWVFVFSYVPIYGLQIAFKQFDFKKGILGSSWIGLKNFEFLFNYKDVGRIFYNTIFLNVLFLLFSMIVSVTLALMFVEIKNTRFKKLSQSIAILPHFVSWTVVALFTMAILGTNGMVNDWLETVGYEKLKIYSDPSVWPTLLVILRIWQGAGFGTVIYIAAITGFDPSMYEAAKVDGASRLQQITKITLPLLKTTIVLLLLLGIGGIFRGDFGMIFALVRDNAQLYPTVDVIDTFVYRALRELNNLGMSTATSFFQSSVGFVIVYITNAIAKKVAPDSAIF